MEGHTWIYLLTILAYLYYMSKVYDRLSTLMNEKSKIVEPKTDKEEDRERWLELNALILYKLKNYRRWSVVLFFLIPALELSAHLFVGNYEYTGQLLSVVFIALFLAVLLVILFVYRGRKSDRLEKKYTWKTSLFNRSKSKQYQA